MVRRLVSLSVKKFSLQVHNPPISFTERCICFLRKMYQFGVFVSVRVCVCVCVCERERERERERALLRNLKKCVLHKFKKTLKSYDNCIRQGMR